MLYGHKTSANARRNDASAFNEGSVLNHMSGNEARLHSLHFDKRKLRAAALASILNGRASICFQHLACSTSSWAGTAAVVHYFAAGRR